MDEPHSGAATHPDIGFGKRFCRRRRISGQRCALSADLRRYTSIYICGLAESLTSPTKQPVAVFVSPQICVLTVAVAGKITMSSVSSQAVSKCNMCCFGRAVPPFGRVYIWRGSVQRSVWQVRSRFYLHSSLVYSVESKYRFLLSSEACWRQGNG